MPTDEIEKALEPKRIIRIFGSIFLIAVLGIALIAGIRMANNAVNSVEATSRDHAWFAQTYEEIHSLDHRIEEARQALEKHREEVSSRWVSRSDDRAQTQRLTQLLLSLLEQRATLVKEYNVAAELATPEILASLPKNISASDTHQHSEEGGKNEH